MKRLSHPNIIQFVEVYEDPDHLMMVMEYFSGDELFDVILARKYFSEDDAKPIFQQIVKALFYLHSLNIIHRDVKPENVLISQSPDPATGMVVAKLLDFGLSKNAGAGSAAKTFVGTPCYVAPEVEYTSKGLGGTYGFPADCWSLGALLYVMLVARFPEFEQNNVGKIVLKLPPVLWNNVSGEAKDLIRSLMNTNPSERATMGSVLLHPWLGKYRCTNDDLLRWTTATRQLSTLLREEEARMEVYQRANINSSIVPQGSSKVQLHNSQTMVVRSARPPDSTADLDQQLQIAPLLHLQRYVLILSAFRPPIADSSLPLSVSYQKRRQLFRRGVRVLPTPPGCSLRGASRSYPLQAAITGEHQDATTSRTHLWSGAQHATGPRIGD